MTTSPSQLTTQPRAGGIEGYYRLHAGIYDATRWSFLFGREAIITLAAKANARPGRILEIGCGTGKNLLFLARRFPRAQIVGVDLSASMLAIARKKAAPFGPRIHLVQRAYDSPLDPLHGYDLVLCSYSLSMFNPGYDQAISAASRDLAPGGQFALVDFDSSRFGWFARWMGINHVRMNGHLHPCLVNTFQPVADNLCSAYGGVWQYRLFVGRRRT